MSTEIRQEIENACEALRKGGVILYPTDTIWGLGCDATNTEAVKRIYEIKERCDAKAMLILLDSSAKLQAYVDEVPDIAWDLIELSTKPTTLIYPRGRNLAPSLLSEDGSIGIRITTERFSHNLCQRFRRPIVSTSANKSGSPSPATFAEISEEIISLVDYVVDYKRDEATPAQPSAIIKVGDGGLIKIIRE